MNFDEHRAAACLAELELIFLHVGAVHCNQLQDKSQLTSFLLLGLRSQSLLRGMLAVLAEETLDAYDPVRRAFFEAWLVQFDFRFKNSRANSCAIVGMRHKVNLDQTSAQNVVSAYGTEFMGFIVQELWVSVEPDEEFIDTYVRLSDLPECKKLESEYFRDVSHPRSPE